MTAPRLLVVRNDKLGDFMLAWPALALLKRSLPDSHVVVLVPSYTAGLAAICPWIDEVWLDPGDLGRLHRDRVDAVLTLFSTGRIGWQVFKGRIPVRVAPATKWAQYFYPDRVVQRRSRSERPEYVYNLDLAHALLRRLGVAAATVQAPFWPLEAAQRSAWRTTLSPSLGLDMQRPWWFVHCGSGGSALNLSVAQYAALMQGVARRLQAGPQAPQWVLTCGPGEEERVEALRQHSAALQPVVYRSTQGLAAFAASLSAAQCVIAGSTGPLHIAGALDVPTVGFFPAKRSATAWRWRPCNGEGRTLAFSPPASSPDGLSALHMDTCAEQLVAWAQALPV
jgi:ADP-heptose:LPS heptosyltransferase